ncbi:hypothetical protein [Phocaeicola vulgatus]|uniref:hypothetical protein n=1 Tax=Phocaeicola vulgatus TaxID=821 RepID=UPI003DA2AC82
MLEGFIAGKLANKMFEKDVFKIVKRHAFWGALIMILPLFGLDWICFVAILWHMYSAICKKVGMELNFSTIAVGLIVNILVGIALDVLFTFIPFLIGFIVYAQFYFSGKMFIETLKQMK